MQFSLSNDIKYRKTLLTVALLTLGAAVGCILLSYLLVPVAAAFYAVLLFYENPKKRVFSYLIPIAVFSVNLILNISNGIYSPDGVAYVILGLLIYSLCKKGVSKAETVFWLSFVMMIFFAISAVLLGISYKSAEGVSGIVEFYSRLYEYYRNLFNELVASLVTSDSYGNAVFAYTPIEAELLFRELIILLLSILILFVIVLSGISLKIFSSMILKYSGEESGIRDWNFKPSNIVAYFYIAVAILSFLAASDESVFSYVIMSLDIIFAPIFAYMGAVIIHAIIVSHGKSSFFAFFVILIAGIIFYTFSIRLLSFAGVYFTIIANKFSKQ